jgi:hypothetical protein
LKFSLLCVSQDKLATSPRGEPSTCVFSLLLTSDIWCRSCLAPRKAVSGACNNCGACVLVPAMLTYWTIVQARKDTSRATVACPAAAPRSAASVSPRVSTLIAVSSSVRCCSRYASAHCFNCQRLGHMAADCKAPRVEKGQCYNCKSTEHLARDCPEDKPTESGSQCFLCKETGHFARCVLFCTKLRAEFGITVCSDCKQNDKKSSAERTCFKCQQCEPSLLGA